MITCVCQIVNAVKLFCWCVFRRIGWQRRRRPSCLGRITTQARPAT